MYSELLPLARTEEELEILKKELDELKACLYKPEGVYEEALSKKVRAGTAGVIRQFTAQGVIKDKAKFFEEIGKALDSFKTLELTIAFEPREETIERIWEWVRKNVGEGVVVKFKVEHAIGAGCILVYQGKYRNYSFSKRLKDDFASQKQALLKMLN